MLNDNVICVNRDWIPVASDIAASIIEKRIGVDVLYTRFLDRQEREAVVQTVEPRGMQSC